MTDCSIVVVSFNTRRLLRECLRSVCAQRDSLSIGVFVVDNASEDGSCEMVATEFPQIRLLRNTTNVGFAAANNQALEIAEGRYLLLLNPDTVVLPAALQSLVVFMDGHKRAGYCGPKLLSGDGTLQPSARRFPTLLSQAYALTGLDKTRPDSRHCLSILHHHDFDTPSRADWLTGACLLVRREAVEEVGLLDSHYFMYFEETDWCRRLAAVGWEGWYVPGAEVIHHGGGSLADSPSDTPFFGNHPTYWVDSRRHYLRRHFGFIPMLLHEAIDLALQIAIWMRHRWRREPESHNKARRASAAIRHLLRS